MKLRCLLFGHKFDRGIARGWSGIVRYTCTRCSYVYHSQFDM